MNKESHIGDEVYCKLSVDSNNKPLILFKYLPLNNEEDFKNILKTYPTISHNIPDRQYILIRHGIITGLCLRVSSKSLTWTIDKWRRKRPWRLTLGNTILVSYQEACEIAGRLIKVKGMDYKLIKRKRLADDDTRTPRQVAIDKFADKWCGKGSGVVSEPNDFPDFPDFPGVKVIHVPINKQTPQANTAENRTTPRDAKPALPTLWDILPEYIEANKPKIGTIKMYRHALKNTFKSVASIPYDTIDRFHIRAVHEVATVSNFDNGLKALRALLNYAAVIHMTKNTVVQDYKATNNIKQPPVRDNFLQLDKIPAFIQYLYTWDGEVGKRNRQHVIALLFTGCRHQSARTIQQDGEFIIIYEQKGGHGEGAEPLAVKSILPTAVQSLNIDYQSLKVDINRNYVEKMRSDWDLIPHDLRRTYSTLLSHLGVSKDSIARITGHIPQDTTGKYIQLSDLTLRDIRAKLDGFLTEYGIDKLLTA